MALFARHRANACGAKLNAEHTTKGGQRHAEWNNQREGSQYSVAEFDGNRRSGDHLMRRQNGHIGQVHEHKQRGGYWYRNANGAKDVPKKTPA